MRNPSELDYSRITPVLRDLVPNLAKKLMVAYTDKESVVTFLIDAGYIPPSDIYEEEIADAVISLENLLDNPDGLFDLESPWLALIGKVLVDSINSRPPETPDVQGEWELITMCTSILQFRNEPKFPES